MIKSQELKEKIIKEQLPNLSVDPLGSYVNAEELSRCSYKSYEDYYYNGISAIEIDPESILSEEDYQEICQAMVNDIKKHAGEWKIEKEGSLEIIKHNLGKKHYKEGFDEEEWNEIEQILSFDVDENDMYGENEEQENTYLNFLPQLQGENENWGFDYDREGTNIGFKLIGYEETISLQQQGYNKVKSLINTNLVLDYSDDYRQYQEEKQIESRTKRQLSLSTEFYDENKLVKLSKLTNELEPTEIVDYWQNLHLNFTPKLIQNWTSHHFTSSQTQDWINIGLSASDHSLASWLRDFKKLTPEQVLNHYNLETLRQEFETYQAQIEISAKPFSK